MSHVKMPVKRGSLSPEESEKIINQIDFDSWQDPQGKRRREGRQTVFSRGSFLKALIIEASPDGF